MKFYLLLPHMSFSPSSHRNKPSLSCSTSRQLTGMLFALTSGRDHDLFWGSFIIITQHHPAEPLTAALCQGAQHCSPPASLTLPNEEGAAGSSDQAGWAGWSSPRPEQELGQTKIVFLSCQPLAVLSQGPSPAGSSRMSQWALPSWHWWHAGGYHSIDVEVISQLPYPPSPASPSCSPWHHLAKTMVLIGQTSLPEQTLLWHHP